MTRSVEILMSNFRLRLQPRLACSGPHSQFQRPPVQFSARKSPHTPVRSVKMHGVQNKK